MFLTMVDACYLSLPTLFTYFGCLLFCFLPYLLASLPYVHLSSFLSPFLLANFPSSFSLARFLLLLHLHLSYNL